MADQQFLGFVDNFLDRLPALGGRSAVPRLPGSYPWPSTCIGWPVSNSSDPWIYQWPSTSMGWPISSYSAAWIISLTIYLHGLVGGQLLDFIDHMFDHLTVWSFWWAALRLPGSYPWASTCIGWPVSSSSASWIISSTVWVSSRSILFRKTSSSLVSFKESSRVKGGYT